MIEVCIFEREQDFSVPWGREVERNGGVVAELTDDLFDYGACEIPFTKEEYLVMGIWLEQCIGTLILRLLDRNNGNTVTVDLARTRGYWDELDGESLTTNQRRELLMRFPAVKEAIESGRVNFG